MPLQGCVGWLSKTGTTGEQDSYLPGLNPHILLKVGTRIMEQDRIDFFRNLLQERLERLLQEAGETLGDLTEDKESLADALDIATMESNRDFQLRIRDRERVFLRKIQQALQQIEDGEYGYCQACGEEIGEQRLIARIVATHCIDCKTEAEQLERRSRSY